MSLSHYLRLGEEGQLGHEDKTKVELKPRMVDSLEGMGVRQVNLLIFL